MNNIFEKNNFKLWLLILFLGLIYGLGFTLSEFHDNPYDGIKDFCILGMQWFVVFVAIIGLLYALILNKYVFAITFPMLTMVCTMLTFYRYTANIVLTPMIIDLAMVNDARTCLDVFSVQLIFYLIFALCFSILIVYYRWKYIKIQKWYYHLLIPLTLIMLTNVLVQRFVRPVSERMPYSIFYNFVRYFNEKQIVSENRTTFEESSVSCPNDSIIVVFVLGESLRYDHLQLNGYERCTTPLLSQDTAVVSYPNIYSESCYTHRSVPHILTRADSINPERAYNEPSFITLFNKSGFRTSWLANQESVDTYVYFMNESDTLIYANRGQSLYRFDKWLDEDLLPYYKYELQNENSKKLILLHTIGSHWWYNSHFTEPFEKFKPVIKSRVISSCTNEEIVNSYDNTILYTDYFISQLIKDLKGKKAILFYLSDHGENLGEDGSYFHGGDNMILHRPACFIWYSSEYALSYPEKIKSLKNNRLKNYRTDFMFHSILDAAGIESDFLNKDLSILNE